MRRPLSLANRMTLLFGITSTIVFALFGWRLNHSIRNHFIEEDISELELIADFVPVVLTDIDALSNVGELEQRFNDILVGHHRASLYIMDRNGNLIYRSAGPNLSIALDNTPSPDNDLRVWKYNDHSYRVLIRHISIKVIGPTIPFTLIAAVPIDYHLRFLSAFQRTLWLMITSSILLMSLMGFIAVKQGHAPLRRIVGKIRRITTDELNTQIDPDTLPSELQDLAESFNDMLKRVNQGFQRLSEFNADIAHELRTPITSLLTQSQVALTQVRSLDEYREILYSNIEEYERIAQMIGDMLFLAQTDNLVELPNKTIINLEDEISALYEYYEAWAEERNITLAIRGSARVQAEKSLLLRAFGNLLPNALRHTPDGDEVLIYLSHADDGTVLITIENPGETIPPEHLSRLFDRFYRTDASRQRSEEGSGLGLAITKSIAEAHNGTIRVASDAGITRFTIALPGVDQ